LSIVNLVSSH